MTFWMVDLVPLKRAYVKENVLFFKKKKKDMLKSLPLIFMNFFLS
jgi:hypothetical protein